MLLCAIAVFSSHLCQAPGPHAHCRALSHLQLNLVACTNEVSPPRFLSSLSSAAGDNYGYLPFTPARPFTPPPAARAAGGRGALARGCARLLSSLPALSPLSISLPLVPRSLPLYAMSDF